MNRLRFLLLLWVLLYPLSSPAEQALRLVADPWPPFTDKSLLNNGVASDLVVNALARAGYTTVYAQVPWERAVRGLQQGTYDVLINAWYKEDRKEFGYYSQPYLINRVSCSARAVALCSGSCLICTLTASLWCAAMPTLMRLIRTRA
jgi:polar amino acid transport system substrate-binding protein